METDTPHPTGAPDAHPPEGSMSLATQGLSALSLPPGGRYMVTGGGTGGHVYPAIAIADELRRRDPSATFLYVGVKGKSEEAIVPRRGYPLTFVRSEGFPGGRNPIRLGLFALKLALGVLRSIFLILTFRPTLVIGTGGYVSAPAMLAAIILRRLGLTKARTFIHEQNTFPGRLNRLVGSLVDCVGVSFPETLSYFPAKGVYVGYPVRKEMGDVDRAAARAELGIPLESRVVFAFGGSQGARTINRAMVDALPTLIAQGDLYIIHGTGTMDSAGYHASRDTEARLKAAGLLSEGLPYLRDAYFHNIETLYAASDLVVCRAGAGTLTEICARGLPALIIPKAGLPGDHQVKNARALAARDGGRVLYERVDPTSGTDIEVVEGGDLAGMILDLLADSSTLERYRVNARAAYSPGSLERIAAVLAQLVTGQSPDAGADAPPATGPDLEAMSHMGLMVFLRRARRLGRALGLTPQDIAYLRYRTDRYLSSPGWEVRNNGVKLVGLLGYEERLPLLIQLLEEREPVPWHLRMVGGDFKQVGFIRRNIFDALVQLDTPHPDLHRALQLGLTDSYFEVRTAAARCAGHYADRLETQRDAVEAMILTALRDPSFEVQMEACRALGRLSDTPEVLAALRPLYFAPNWEVRQGVVQGLAALFERGILDEAQVREALGSMLITSNGFVPYFPLKAEIRGLAEALNDRAGAPL